MWGGGFRNSTHTPYWHTCLWACEHVHKYTWRVSRLYTALGHLTWYSCLHDKTHVQVHYTQLHSQTRQAPTTDFTSIHTHTGTYNMHTHPHSHAGFDREVDSKQDCLLLILLHKSNTQTLLSCCCENCACREHLYLNNLRELHSAKCNSSKTRNEYSNPAYITTYSIRHARDDREC